jgi:hypothetical protein
MISTDELKAYGEDSPAPLSQESLWGYTHRLAAEHRITRHVWLRNDIGVVGNEAELDGEQLKRLSIVSGAEPQVLRRLQHGHSHQSVALFFKNRVPRLGLEFVRSRICPQCFLEAGCHNRIFDLRMLRACPIHKIELVEICPKCSTELTWHRNSISHCPGGDELWWENQLDFEPNRIDRPLEAEALIFERCGQLPEGYRSVLLSLPDDIGRLALTDQLDLFYVLGEATRDFPDEYKRGRQRRHATVPTWQILNEGLEMARQLPDSLHSWLSERYAPGGRGPSDMGDLIKPLQHALSDHLLANSKALKLLRRPLTEFARKRGHSGTPTSRWVDRLDPSDNEITLEQAAARMSVSLRRAKAIAINEAWAVFTPKQNTAATRVRRDVVESWVKQGGDDLGCEEASRLLGIPPTDVMELARKNIVGGQKIQPRGHKVGARDWRFRRGTLIRLKDRLRDQLLDKECQGTVVTFRQYRKMRKSSTSSYPKLIRAILKGVIRPLAWPTNGRLEQISFDLRELEKCLRGTDKRTEPHANRRKPLNSREYSPKALQIRFSTSARVIELAIKQGHLKATEREDGSPVVSAADLEAFEAVFTFINKAAKDRKIASPVTFAHDLRQAGIIPAVKLDGSLEGSLYLANEISAI